MGTCEEYIQKSCELFALIAGKFSVKDERVTQFQQEYAKLLVEVVTSGSYPVGTSQDVCPDPVAGGYAFGIDHSFGQSEKAAIAGYYAHQKTQLYDLEGEGRNPKYLGNLAAAKSKCRYAVLTKDKTNIRAIRLMNELFYKTPPVLLVDTDTIRANPKPIVTTPVAPHSRASGILPSASWDVL